MIDSLRIEVEIDGKDYNPILDYEFVINEHKDLIIKENWQLKEEIWSAGKRIKIPAWVWKQAGPWIMEHMK